MTSLRYILFYARIDSEPETPPISNITIPPHLMNEVVQDNKKFLNEMEAQSRRQQQQVPVYSRSDYKPDDDYSNNGGGNFGGGGFGGGFGGGGFGGGGRFIF